MKYNGRRATKWTLVNATAVGEIAKNPAQRKNWGGKVVAAAAC